MAPLNELVFEEIDEYSYVPDELGNCSWVKPGGNINEFYCQINGYDSGLIYKCKLTPLDEADEAVQEEPFDSYVLDDEQPVTCWIERDQRIYAGYSNGKIRAFHLEDESYNDEILAEGLPNHHTLEMHDCQTGSIVNMTTTTDGQFLVSCGADGNMFSYELVNPKQTTLVELPSSVVDGMYKGEEVKGSYSLEEDKQKSEMDRKIKEANLLKV